MLLRFLHRFRIALASSIGVAIALAATAGIFLSLKADPASLSLADRIDPNRAMVFVATSDREMLFAMISHFESLIEKGPSEDDVAPADRYEFVLLNSGSGSTDWIVYGRNDSEKTHVTVVSQNDTALFLPLTKRHQSLATTSLFAHAQKQTTSLLWFKTALLPLPNSQSADIARAVLAPYKEAAVLFSAAGQGRLIFMSTTMNLRGSAPEVTPAKSDTSLLSTSLGDPATVFGNIANALVTENPSLAEGLIGILKTQAQKLIGSTDLSQIIHDLLSGPMSLTVQRGEEDGILFTVSGTALDPVVLETWLMEVASAQKEGSVRRMEFFGKEYVRNDVTANDKAGWMDDGTYKNWTLQSLGGTGSDLSLVLARSGRRYIVGNTSALVKEVIDSDSTSSYGGLGNGTADIGWLSEETETRLPFLQPVQSTVEALLGSSPSHLTWRAAYIGGYLTIDWSLSRIQTRP